MSSSDLNEDRSATFRHIAIAFIVLPTVAVLVRFWSRIVANRTYLGWDDWTCLLALLLSVGLCTVGIIWSHYGFGRHVATISPSHIEISYQLLFAAYFLFDIGIGIVKFSALFFYGRVFRNASRRFTYALYTGHLFTAFWLMFAVPIIVCNCIPVRKTWKQEIPGKCLNTYAVYLTSGIFDAVVDLYVLILPMPILWRLQTSKSRRILTAAALACGYCCFIASLGRLVSIIKLGPAIGNDFTWNAATVLQWSFVEPAVGIISICLPSWFYLIRRLRRHGTASLFTTKDDETLDRLRSLKDSNPSLGPSVSLTSLRTNPKAQADATLTEDERLWRVPNA